MYFLNTQYNRNMKSVGIQAFFFLFFISTWIIGYLARLTKHGGKDYTRTLCENSIIWCLYLFFCTEILSLMRAISRRSLFCVWIIWLFIHIVSLIKHKEDLHETKNRITERIDHIANILKMDHILNLLILIIAIIEIRSTWLSLITTPANWDSMTYHLTRIMFWMRNRTVTYYDTPNIRQLVTPVLAEYINLHVVCLCGGDSFANMLQNFSSYGCLLFIYSILRELKCSRKWAAVGMLLLETTNAFFAESISTQVDVTASYRLLIVVFILLTIMRKNDLNLDRKNISLFALLGIGAGILFITKSNAAISAATIGIFAILLRIYRHDRVSNVIGLFSISGLCAVLIALPTFIRNYRFCGDILASDYVGKISIGTLRPKYVIVNMLKNIVMAAVNRNNAGVLYDFLVRISNLMSVDVNSELISYNNNNFVVQYSLDMDCSSAHLVMFLIILVLVAGGIRLIWKRKYMDLLNVILLIQFFVTTCFVRWQVWVVRLMLPAIVISIIPVSYFLNNFLTIDDVGQDTKKSMKQYITFAVMALLLIESLGCHMEMYRFQKEKTYFDTYTMNYTLEKFYRYFTYRGNDGAYAAMCFLVENDDRCHNIGMDIDKDSYQYPVLARWYNKYNIHYVTLKKDMGNTSDSSRVPDAVMVFDKELKYDDPYYYNGERYSCCFSENVYSLWKRESL